MQNICNCIFRARYIFEDGDHELSANFLINIGFNENKEDYSPEFCYRALEVLQSVVDRVKLEDLTKRDYQTIRYHMPTDHLYFLKLCNYLICLNNCISETI